MSEAFDPDAYLAEAEDTSDFNPDQYLEETRDVSPLESGIHGAVRGASMGFIDELSGVGEAAGRAIGVKGLGGKFSDIELQSPSFDFAKNYEEGRDKKRAMHEQLKEANPASYMTGEIGGGVTSALIPGLGAAKGIRGAAGAGAALGGAHGMGNSEAEDAQGMAVDTLTGMGIGAIGGGAGYGIGKGLEKGANLVSQKVAPGLEKMLPIGKKGNAAEIEAAAKSLGIKPTPGMLNASERVQGLESSLHQAPTIGGWLTRKGTEPVVKGMQSATDDLASGAATVSPFESGESVKKILASEVGRKFKGATDTFDDLAKYTKDIPATQTSTKAVGRNIMRIPEVEVLDLPLAKQVVAQLEKNPSADQIKMLRTMVGKKAKSAMDGAERSAYWQIYAKLGKLEENTIKRGVIASARSKPEGETIAQGMLGQLRGAKKAYSAEMGNLDEVAQSARLGKFGGPSGFVDKVDAIPSERLQEKLLPLNDVRLAQSMQKNFPEAFSGLKAARLRDLTENIVEDGVSMPGKFLRNTRDLNPEAQGMLFGDKSPKLNALRTVNEALPDKVGPSGTSQALDFKEMLNPLTQVRDLARYGTYKAVSSETLNKVAQFLRSQPRFANMAEQNPKAFQAAVYQFAQKVNPEGGAYKAAGFDPNKPQSDEQAREAFLDQ